MVQTVCRTISQAQVVEVLAEVPQLQLVEKLCDPRGPDGPVHPDLWEFGALYVSASNCGGPQLQLIVFLMRLIGPCTQA